MMSEVVDHRDAAHHAADFLAAFDPLEGGQGLLDLRHRHAVEMRGRSGHGGVANVEVADQRNLKRHSEELE